jgi:hypothetical protein
MNPDDIQFFDVGKPVVVKIGETEGGEVRFCIAKVVDIIFITDDDTIKVQQYSVKFTNEYDNDTCWYDACDVFKNIDSLMESIKQKKNKTKGK